MKKILTFAAILVLSVAVLPFLTGQSIAQEQGTQDPAEQVTYPQPQGCAPAGYPRQTQSAAPTTVLGRLFTPKPYCPPTASQPAYAGAGQPNGQDNTRIVYVPYSCPPPIYIERMERMKRNHQARGLLSIGRQATAAGYLQEYPEMPQNFYTTRGPRDFLIPTEKFPSIGY